MYLTDGSFSEGQLYIFSSSILIKLCFALIIMQPGRGCFSFKWSTFVLALFTCQLISSSCLYLFCLFCFFTFFPSLLFFIFSLFSPWWKLSEASPSATVYIYTRLCPLLKAFLCCSTLWALSYLVFPLVTLLALTDFQVKCFLRAACVRESACPSVRHYPSFTTSFCVYFDVILNRWAYTLTGIFKRLSCVFSLLTEKCHTLWGNPLLLLYVCLSYFVFSVPFHLYRFLFPSKIIKLNILVSWHLKFCVCLLSYSYLFNFLLSVRCWGVSANRMCGGGGARRWG